MVSAEHLDAQTTYPQPGIVVGEVIQRSLDATGREVICIDTERPWHIESVDGVTKFEVPPESLVAGNRRNNFRKIAAVFSRDPVSPAIQF